MTFLTGACRNCYKKIPRDTQTDYFARGFVATTLGILLIFASLFLSVSLSLHIPQGHRNCLNTPNKLEYKFHAVRGGSLLIDVKAKSNGHIALTCRKGESSPMYEIMLGGWDNTASIIRYDRKQPDKVRQVDPLI